MNKTTLLEIIDAAHLTNWVESPFKQRGGIMLVGPPSSMKTTFIENTLANHYDALVVGDINIQTLIKLRDDFRTGRYHTLAFTEFEKLYQRRGETAINTEGSIKQYVEEGFSRASFEDQRMQLSKARCLVVGAMTEGFYRRKFSEWEESGFLRRFLWCNFSVSNAYLLTDSISRWEMLDLGDYKTKSPGNKSIPYAVTEAEDHKIKSALKDQFGITTPFVLLKKILCVLKWKYEKQEPGKAFKILVDFTEVLRKDGGSLKL